MENHHFSWENSRTKWPFSSSLFWHTVTRGYLSNAQREQVNIAFHHGCHRGNHGQPILRHSSTSGRWLTDPSEKYEFVSWEYYSQYMETIKHVPNHQPVICSMDNDIFKWAVFKTIQNPVPFHSPGWLVQKDSHFMEYGNPQYNG